MKVRRSRVSKTRVRYKDKEYVYGIIPIPQQWLKEIGIDKEAIMVVNGDVIEIMSPETYLIRRVMYV